MNRYTFDQIEVTVAKEKNGDLQAAYIYLPSHPQQITGPIVGKTIDVGHGVILDLDVNGTLIGIEIIFPLNTNSSK